MKTQMFSAMESAVKRRFPILSRAANLPALVVGVGTLVATTGARADGAIALPDVGAVTTAITGVVTIVSSIGIAALSVVVTVRLFGWIRSALR